MKPARSIVWLLLILVVACREEELPPATNKVAIVFNLAENTIPENSRSTFDLPPGAEAELVIIDEQKNEFIHRVVALDEWSTKPIELSPGLYSLDEFLIIADEEVILASPRTGAKLASVVENALPQRLPLASEENTVVVSVLPSSAGAATDFGYTSFRKKVSQPFRIRVFTRSDGKVTPSSALLSLESGDSVIFEATLGQQMNMLSYPADPLTMYTLRVSKEGFYDQSIDFSYGDYLSEFGSRPFEVILDEKGALSFWTEIDPELYLTFFKRGSIEVRWPDGEAEQISFDPQPGDQDKLSFIYLTHELNGASGEITVTGDVENVVELVSLSPVTAIDVSGLINLQSLTIENGTLDELNLKHNQELASVGFVNTSLENLFMPPGHNISSVLLEGTTTFPTDVLVSSVYRNAMEENITEGAFIVFNAYPLSSESVVELLALERSYQWYIEIE